MRMHHRMPANLGTDAARRWLKPGPLPAELLAPYPADEMRAWRFSDVATNSTSEPHPGMAERLSITTPQADRGPGSTCLGTRGRRVCRTQVGPDREDGGGS